MSNQISTLAVPSMSSRKIAEVTYKHHKHVLRDIRSMLQDLDLIDNPYLGCQQYQIVSRNDNNQTNYIILDKELTLTLVSGYIAVCLKPVLVYPINH